MTIKIGKKLEARLTKRHWGSLWGQRLMVRPVLIHKHLGDGNQLLAVTPLATRPDWYLIRVDSSWNTSNYSDPPTISEHLDEIYEAIEDECGRGGYLDKYESHTGRARHEPWPALDLSCGVSWCKSHDLLPKAIRNNLERLQPARAP